MRIGKGFIVLLVALFGIGLLVRYAFRDISLDVDLLRESLQRMPGLVLENLEFEREISGDFWQVEIPLAERRDGMVEVRSVDIRRLLANGREWYFKGASGVYSEKEESADLYALLGTLETDVRVLNLESPRLSWSREKNDFFFPYGVTIYDSEFILTAKIASIDESGVVLLDKGGVIEWMKNIE